MTTLATLSDLNEAFLLRSMLEANEIPAFIPDENTCQSNWGYINAIGGVRVQVPEEFVDQARSVLAQFKENPNQDAAPEAVVDPTSSPERARIDAERTTQVTQDPTNKRKSSTGGLLLVLVAFVMVMGIVILIEHRQEEGNVFTAGNDAYANGNYDLAISDYSRGIQLDPKNQHFYINRGLAYAARGNQGTSIDGDNDKAIADYNQAISLDPNDANGYDYRGISYEKVGNYAKAIEDFDKALQLDSKDEQIYFNRGYAFQRKGDQDAAVADLSQAIQLDPKNEPAYSNRGMAYDDKGEFDKAIADYDDAIILNPKDEYALTNRGKAYADKGDNEKAIADYNRALSLDPQDTQTYFNRGDAYAEQGKRDKAIADFSQAIQIDPKDVNAYFNRGSAYDDNGDYSNAIGDYKRIIQIDPKYGNAYNSLAWDLATDQKVGLRNGKQAVQYGMVACRLSDWKDSSAIDTLAAACAAAGDFSNAVKWEQRALETPGQNKTTVVEEQKRLLLYRTGKPYQGEK